MISNILAKLREPDGTSDTGLLVLNGSALVDHCRLESTQPRETWAEFVLGAAPPVRGPDRLLYRVRQDRRNNRDSASCYRPCDIRDICRSTSMPKTPVEGSQ